MKFKDKPGKYSLTRRFFLYLGSLCLLFPVISFLRHKVKKKPIYIEINKKLNTGDYFVTKDFVLFVEENEIWATNRKCTHLGCKINFYEKENYFECPCHQSKFTRKGEVLKGPATRSLQKFPVEIIPGDNIKYIVSI